MRHPKPYARSDTRLLHATLLALSLMLLAGCSSVGDFGRPKYISQVLVEPDPAVTGKIPSQFPLTDDERQLRALASGLLAAPLVIDKPRSIDHRQVTAGSFGPHAQAPEGYAEFLVRGPFRSSAARYARLIDDTRDDIARLDQFFAVARRVADIDQKRERSLAHVTALSADELADARRRIRENMVLMADVHAALREHAIAYRFALERLVIAMPSAAAVDAERTRGELEQRLAAIRVTGRQDFVVGPRPSIAK